MAGKRRQNMMAKALGITTSINRKTGAERTTWPSAAFADDYNRLRTAALECYPELAGLLPPDVDVSRGQDGERHSSLSFGEIDAFAEQIYQLLAEQDDLP